MNFQSNFQQRLIKDLDDGVYSNASSFAAGITRHYMSSLSLNAPTTFGPTLPAQIPLTLPAPAQLGAPAPVGPTSPLTNKKRQKVFQNTVRAYFVAKEISIGKVQILQLSRDIKSTTARYKDITRQVKDYYNRIQELDDQLQQLKDSIESAVPELKKFIQSKKNILLQTKTEIQTLRTKFRQLNQQGLSDFNFEAIIQDELEDLEFFLNLEVNISFDFGAFEDSFEAIRGILDRSINTTRKYTNIFSREATYKAYFAKKIEAAAKEVLRLVNAFFQPEKYIAYWKELIYIPGGRRIGKIMLNFINNNKVLKEAKKKLLVKVENLKTSVKQQLDRKLDALLEKLDEAKDYVITRLKIKERLSKFQEKLQSSKIINNILKAVKAKIKFIKNVVKHAKLVLAEISKIAVKLYGLYEGIKQVSTGSQQIVRRIKDKYQSVQNDIEISKSPEAQQRRQEAFDGIKDFDPKAILNENPAKSVANSLQISTPILTTILSDIQKLLSLNSVQLAAFIRSRSRRVQSQIKSIDQLLTKDIPRLQVLLNANPNSSNYKQQINKANAISKSETGLVGVASVFAESEGTPKTYLFLVKLCRLAGEKLEEMQNKLLQRIKAETTSLLDVNKQKDAVLDYVNTITEKNPKIKKIKNKKAAKELDIAAIKAKVLKLKKLAKQVRLGTSIVINGYRVFVGLMQNTQTPISSNENAVRSLVASFCDLQIDRGKMERTRKAKVIKDFNVKIADLKAYEAIYRFITEIIKEAQSTKIVDKIKQELGEKAEQLDAKTKAALQGLFDILEGVRADPSITTIANIPPTLFGQINIVTSIIAAERRAFLKLRNKIKNLGSFIPPKTTDPGLLFIRGALRKTSSIILLIFNGVSKFFKTLVSFMEKIMDPVFDFVRRVFGEQKDKIVEQERERINTLIERKTNLEGRVMSLMFGLAARLFWTGITWQNAVGTRFLVLNVGSFRPQMKSTSENGAQGYGEELAKGFNNQLRNMTGLVIPVPSTGIVPFTFKGYLPLQAQPPQSLTPAEVPDSDYIYGTTFI